jgi:mono/diheme cytochrome c family protein
MNPGLLALTALVLLTLTGCASQTTLKPLTASEQGEGLFSTHCAGCHAGGGNTMNPAKPVKGSEKLKDKAAFIAFLRQPGGGMPAYDAATLSDSDADVLRQYLANTYGTP